MDFLEQIRNLDDEEIKKVVKRKIEELEKSKHNDPKEIGFIVDKDPTAFESFEIDGVKCFELGMNCFHPGYIKKGTKIIYGLSYDNNAQARNEGAYYYLDDEEYLYEFCKYIKDKDIVNEYELFDYILLFLRSYFGVIEDRSRSDMFKLIWQDEKRLFSPVKEHSIKDFKGKGNALCTEYSVTSQNILSLFGIEAYLFIGNERLDDEKGSCHAFNMISFNESDTGEEVNALIDFSTPVNIFDINFNVTGVSPYITYLSEFNEEFVEDFLYHNRNVTAEDYAYYIIGDSMLNVAYERNRTYYIDSMVYSEEKLIAKK